MERDESSPKKEKQFSNGRLSTPEIPHPGNSSPGPKFNFNYNSGKTTDTEWFAVGIRNIWKDGLTNYFENLVSKVIGNVLYVQNISKTRCCLWYGKLGKKKEIESFNLLKPLVFVRPYLAVLHRLPVAFLLGALRLVLVLLVQVKGPHPGF